MLLPSTTSNAYGSPLADQPLAFLRKYGFLPPLPLRYPRFGFAAATSHFSETAANTTVRSFVTDIMAAVAVVLRSARLRYPSAPGLKSETHELGAAALSLCVVWRESTPACSETREATVEIAPWRRCTAVLSRRSDPADSNICKACQSRDTSSVLTNKVMSAS